jgi:ABC-2 type transport system ATP-binding protein
MKKRLNFARSLLLDAPLYMCDEPTTGVDVDSALGLRAIIRELRDQGRTVLLVSHNLDEVAALADRVGLMRDGRIVHEDSPAGLRGLIAPREISIELGGPAPVAFLSELAELPGVESVGRADGEMHLLVRAAQPEDTLQSVIGVVHRHGLPVASLGIVRPDLTEVFRYLLGR